MCIRDSVHPSDISGLNEETFAWLKEQASLPKTVAIGEIGLDYYWDKEPEVQNAQRYWFRRQMELARETNLPVIIHSRDAAADTMEVMKSVHAEEIPGVIHCYSYSPEMAKEFVKMGYYIGVGGVVTFKNAKKLVQTVHPRSVLLLVILQRFKQAYHGNATFMFQLFHLYKSKLPVISYKFYSTVTDLAKFLGWPTSIPLQTAIW